ncbi:MAG: hypothetical protein ACOYT8_02745 [Candidatus Dependentiae bacterium]
MYLTWNLLSKSIKEAFAFYKKNFVILFFPITLIYIATLLLSYIVNFSLAQVSPWLAPLTNQHFYIKIIIDLILQSIKAMPFYIGLTNSIGYIHNLNKKNNQKKLFHQSIRDSFLLYISMALLVLLFLGIVAHISIPILVIGGYFQVNPQNLREVHYIIGVATLFFMCSRFIFFIPEICVNQKTPIAALLASWNLSKKATLKLLIMLIITLQAYRQFTVLFKRTPIIVLKIVVILFGISWGIFILLLWLTIHCKLQQARINHNQQPPL